MTTRTHIVAMAMVAVGIVIGAIGCTAPASVEDGGRLYHANGCANCHGAEGHGDGPVGRTLVPPPRDFRDASAFRNGADVASIAVTLARGLGPAGGQMPRFDHLSETERRSIAMFVTSLRAESGHPPNGENGHPEGGEHTR